MPDDSTKNEVLYRMAGIETGSDGSGGDDPSPGLDRALAEAMVRSAASIPGLPLTVKSYSTERKVREVALSASPTPGTILPLLPTGTDFNGAVIIDASLTDALVEVQTLGRVEKTARAARSPTRIDAALCRGFAMRILKEASGKPGVPAFADLHPNRHLSLSAQLELEVSMPSLIVVDLFVSFADSERTGAFTLMLPDRPRAALPAPDQASKGARKKKQKPDPRMTLSLARARLEAVLPSVTISLGELLALEVGDSIDLPPKALQMLKLTGRRLGTGRTQRQSDIVIEGRLGQQDGKRAVKIGDAGGLGAASEDGPTTEGAAGLPATEAALPPPSSDDMPTLSSMPALQTADDLPDMPALDAPDLGSDDAGLSDLPDLDDMAASMPDLDDLPDLDLPG